MNISEVIDKAGFLFKKNSPTILTGTAVVGVVATSVLAVRATPKAIALLEQEKAKGYELLKREKLALVWKLYIPPVLVGASTIACIICSNSINLKRNAVLASSFYFLEESMTRYQDSVKEVLTEKKVQEVEARVAQKSVDDNPVSDAQIFITKGGETLCRDSFSGRYFKSDIETLRAVENTLNQRLINGSWLSINEFYNEVGLDSIKLGDDLGWVPDNLLQLKFSATLATDGTPCIVVDYVVDPKFDPYQSY